MYQPLINSFAQSGHIVFSNPPYDPGPTSSAPDLPSAPVLQDYHCNYPMTWLTNSPWYHETITQTCSFYLWVDAVQSGLNPPGPPYAVTLSSTMQAIPQNCLVSPFPGTWPEKMRYQVPWPGHAVVTLGYPSYSFAWPFACWAGNTYDH